MTHANLILRAALSAIALLSAGAAATAQTTIHAEQPTNCIATIRDEATGQCLGASSVPTLGRLFPMSTDLMVDALGRVGIGSPAPRAKLDVTADLASNPVLQVTNSSSGVFSGGIEVDTVGTASRSILAFSTGANSVGVEAQSLGGGGTGVFGIAAGGDAVYGVQGLAQPDSPNVGAVGVHGYSYLNTGEGDLALSNGVLGQALGGVGTGVFGVGNVFSLSDGMRGEAHHPAGFGVWGHALGSGGIGVYGQASGGGTAVFAEGDLVTTGVKNFATPHPTDPARELRFVCLEGNESGTYFRGSSHLVDGRAVIAVPEEFRLVSAPDELTVQLTAVGSPARLWVESQDLAQVVVRGDLDSGFHYQVNGIRADFRDYQVLRENRSFRPRVAGQPYGEGLHPAARERLVQNGVLNPDYTPNRATADRLGWQLVERPALPAGPPVRTLPLEGR